MGATRAPAVPPTTVVPAATATASSVTPALAGIPAGLGGRAAAPAAAGASSPAAATPVVGPELRWRRATITMVVLVPAAATWVAPASSRATPAVAPAPAPAVPLVRPRRPTPVTVAAVGLPPRVGFGGGAVVSWDWTTGRLERQER